MGQQQWQILGGEAGEGAPRSPNVSYGSCLPRPSLLARYPRTVNDYPAKTALGFVVVVVGGMAVIAFAPWKTMLGLEKYSIGLARDSSLRPLFLAPFEERDDYESMAGLQAQIEEAILAEIPIGSPEADVVRHIRTHYSEPDLKKKSDWYDQEKWHYRFNAVLQQKDFGTATFTIDYALKAGVLNSVTAYFSAVSL